MNETCKHCKYWLAAVATSTGDMYGECRRYPPEMAQQGLADRSLGPPEEQDVLLIGEWFVTKADEFCGEFSRKPAIPKPSEN